MSDSETQVHNLLDGVTPTGTTESDGVWHSAGRTVADGHDDLLMWDLAGQPALATNQTYHVGLSTRGASANPASLHATIGYRDAAGNVNWANSAPLPIGTSWGRAEATIVIPSGMTPFAFYVAAYGTCPETWMTAATLSYGSPVTLAMAEATAADVKVGGRNLLKNTDYEEHTVTTKTTASTTWGSGFDFQYHFGGHIYNCAFIPYGLDYRCSVDVWLPVDGTLIIDINNYPYGDDSWNGNDNDDINVRTSTHLNVVANTWTRISWGSANTSSKNTNKAPIYVADSVGLLPQSSDVTWKFRGLKVELGNIATDWTPAPEDVATDIAEAADKAGDALDKANANEEKLKDVSKALLSVEENIKALVTGANGSSLMTQTTSGWTFDISKIQQTVSDSANAIANLDTNLDSTNAILDKTRDLLNDVTKKTAYINFATDDSGNPCIELGKNDNPFKLRITNTSMDFMQGSQRIAYLSNHQLYIESSVITDSIYIGNDHTYIWKKRANNHLGLRYV